MNTVTNGLANLSLESQKVISFDFSKEYTKKEAEREEKRIVQLLECNKALLAYPETIACVQKILQKIKPVTSANTLHNVAQIAQWALGNSQSKPVSSQEVTYCAPGTTIGPTKYVHILGHSFAYPVSLLTDVPLAPPDYTVRCEGVDFHFSKKILEKISGFVKAADQFKEKELLSIQEKRASDIALLFDIALTQRPLQDLDREFIWTLFDLAQYLQLPDASESLASQYVRSSLGRSIAHDGPPPIDSEKASRLRSVLKKLDLAKLPYLDYVGLQAIKDWPITELDVSQNPHLDHKATAVLRQMTTLQKLNISSVPSFDDKSMQHIAALTELTSLDISGARSITEESAVNGLSKLTKLTSLKLNDSKVVTTRCMRAISSLPLKNLELRGCAVQFSDLVGLSTLTRLDYSNHVNLKNERLEEIARTFPLLQELILKNCQFSEPQALPNFQEVHRTHLKVITTESK